MAGSELVRLEREYRQRQSFSNGHVIETVDHEIQSRLSAEASIKSTLQLFVKFSAGIVLDSWSETNRYEYVFIIICGNITQLNATLHEYDMFPNAPP